MGVVRNTQYFVNKRQPQACRATLYSVYQKVLRHVGLSALRLFSCRRRRSAVVLRCGKPL